MHIRYMAQITRAPDDAGAATTTSAATTSTSADGGAEGAADAGAQAAAAAAATEAAATEAAAATAATEAAAAEAAAAADPANAVPESADGYALSVGDEAAAILGESFKDDPALVALRAAALAEGLTQKAFNDRLAPALDMLAKAGLLERAFDPAAELTKLGEGGATRRQEVQSFADALLSRSDIDAEMHAELVSLAPTAAGVKLVEAFRKMMGPAGQVDAPGEAAGADQQKAKAAEMRRDPRYETDPAFRNQVDQMRQATYGKP